MTPAKKMQLLLVACALLASGLVAHEGWEQRAYPDPVHGAKVPTACAGVTEGVQLGRTYTEAECLAMTMQAMVKHAAPITHCLPDDMPDTAAPFLKTQVDMAYNIGVNGYLGSSMCRRLKAKDYAGTCDAMLMWKVAGGRDCSIRKNNCYGLWLRRQEQRAACLKALPA